MRPAYESTLSQRYCYFSPARFYFVCTCVRTESALVIAFSVVDIYCACIVDLGSLKMRTFLGGDDCYLFVLVRIIWIPFTPFSLMYAAYCVPFCTLFTIM